MRNPPLCSLADLSAELPRRRGEPRTARYSLNDIADMHEAMDIEEEYDRRWRKYHEQKDRG